MDRNREARRLTMAAAANGLSRRRHKATSLRDSPEEDAPFDLPETARLRDRGASMKSRDRERDREREREREKDRLSIRSKRRRGERLMMHGNRDDGGDDSLEESVNDDEEDVDDDSGGGGGPPSSAKMLPPSNSMPPLSSSSLSNHHNTSGSLQHRKSFPPPAKVFRAMVTSAATETAGSPVSSTWKAADEMIGVSVPRKARSASTKRSHEPWTSTASGGVFASGDYIHRQVSTSPARASPTSILTSPSPPAPNSPSSSSASVRKKMKSLGLKQRPPKSSSSKSSSPAENDIEIEIAEVLYGLQSQPVAPSKQEIAGNDSTKLDPKEAIQQAAGEAKTRASSPTFNSQPSLTLAANSSSSSAPVSAIAPKRKRPRQVKYEEANDSVLPCRSSPILSSTKIEIEYHAKTETPFSNHDKISGSTAENSTGLDSKNPTLIPALPETGKREVNLSSDLKPLAEESQNREVTSGKEEPPYFKEESSSGIRLEVDIINTAATKVSSPAPGKVNQREEKFKIDLMAPARSSPEREYEMGGLAGELKAKATDVEAEDKHLPKENEKIEKNACKEDLNLEREPKKFKINGETESQKQERNLDLKFDSEKSDRESGSAAVSGNKLNRHHVQKQEQQQPSSTEKTAQTSALPLHVSMPGWPGGLPTMGYMAPLQGIVSLDSSSLSSAPVQPPNLFSNQQRPKRCATHCYIARNIHYHQQFTKMNPFWPAAGGSAPLYGAKPCNLNLMPSTDLQGKLTGHGTNSTQDKSPQFTSNSADDAAQSKQFLFQQALPPGTASNILHGPAFIFPMSQQPHASAASVRPATSGYTGCTGASNSASANGSASAPSAGATTMHFSYPNMPGNETQYLAILQNSAYPLPVPSHVGAPPGYRGAPGQAIPFFNGSFYSSQMLHPSRLQPQQQQAQAQQSQKPGNQNPSVSTGSSAVQKHFPNQQQRPGINNYNLQGFPAQKNQSQSSSNQLRQQQTQNVLQSETAGDSPSTADSRISRSSIPYGQNFFMPTQPSKFGLMVGSGPASGNSSLGEKKPQQQGIKAGVEPFVSQPFSMSFTTINGSANTTAPPGLTSVAQNHAIFHSLPEATKRQGNQMIAAAVAAQVAQQKINFGAPEDVKAGANCASDVAEERKAAMSGKTATKNAGQSDAFSRPDMPDTCVVANTVIDGSPRLLSLGSAPTPTPGSSSAVPAHQQMQRNQQQQQQQFLQLQRQQQYAAAAVAAAARSKVLATSNGSVFSDHNVPSSSVAAKFPNSLSGFPQNLVQASGSAIQSPQWKNNNSSRTTTTHAPSPSMSSSCSNPSSLKNVTQKQQTRSQQSQISFAANPKPSPSPQVQQSPSANQSPSPPMLVGSPSNSSISKSASGSPRTTASTSTGNKPGQASSTLSSSQPAKNSPSTSVPNQSHTSGRNIPSVLGNPHVSAAATSSPGTKSQLPHQQQPSKHALKQAQLYFSGGYLQPQQQLSIANINMSQANGYYLQRHQQQPGAPTSSSSSSLPLCSPIPPNNSNTATSDSAKAVAAAANNIKGGSLHTQAVGHSSAPYSSTVRSAGKTHRLAPPGFTYVHAVPATVQVKPATDQKQSAGE